MMTVSWSCRARRCCIGIPGGNLFKLLLTSSTTWLYSGCLLSSSNVGTGSQVSRSTPRRSGHTLRRKSSAENCNLSLLLHFFLHLRPSTHHLLIHIPIEQTPSTSLLVYLGLSTLLQSIAFWLFLLCFQALNTQ